MPTVTLPPFDGYALRLVPSATIRRCARPARRHWTRSSGWRRLSLYRQTSEIAHLNAQGERPVRVEPGLSACSNTPSGSVKRLTALHHGRADALLVSDVARGNCQTRKPSRRRRRQGMRPSN